MHFLYSSAQSMSEIHLLSYNTLYSLCICVHLTVRIIHSGMQIRSQRLVLSLAD